MIQNEFSHQHISCDECGDDLDDFGKAEFHQMIADAKLRGWTFEPVQGGNWEHYCPTCRPKETPLQRARRMFGR